MGWLKSVAVDGHWSSRDFHVDLVAPDREMPRHLILTGPNGAGKTTILKRLGGALLTSAVGRGVGRQLFSVSLTWTSDAASNRRAFDKGRLILAYLPAVRTSSMPVPQGPTTKRFGQPAPETLQAAGFLQYLVDQQVQARLADPDDSKERAERDAIFAWFADLEGALAELFERESVKLVFDRKAYNISIALPGQPPVSFNQLAAGHAAAVAIVAELILRIDATFYDVSRADEALSGVVVIDELALHLHPSLQEKILPFLVRLFPRLQFVVATHSPAIICSVPDAMVVDLGSGRVVPSHELQGTPYGELMRTHFGIATDIDLDSTRALERLEALNAATDRTPEQDAELAALAERLTRTSHPLALQVWNRVTAQRLMAEARDGAGA